MYRFMYLEIIHPQIEKFERHMAPKLLQGSYLLSQWLGQETSSNDSYIRWVGEVKLGNSARVNGTVTHLVLGDYLFWEIVLLPVD